MPLFDASHAEPLGLDRAHCRILGRSVWAGHTPHAGPFSLDGVNMHFFLSLAAYFCIAFSASSQNLR